MSTARGFLGWAAVCLTAAAACAAPAPGAKENWAADISGWTDRDAGEMVISHDAAGNPGGSHPLDAARKNGFGCRELSIAATGLKAAENRASSLPAQLLVNDGMNQRLKRREPLGPQLARPDLAHDSAHCRIAPAKRINGFVVHETLRGYRLIVSARNSL